MPPSPGILVRQDLTQLVADGTVLADPAVEGRQLQPASLDVRLDELTLFTFDLTLGAILERGTRRRR